MFECGSEHVIDSTFACTIEGLPDVTIERVCPRFFAGLCDP
jgi:hypothetical protein